MADEIVFEPGQVWSYHTRKGEDDSRLLIVVVDDAGIHIQIDRVNLPSQTMVIHAPMTEESLRRSVVALDDSVFDFNEEWFALGFSNWTNEGGTAYFTLTVAEVLDLYIQLG